MSADDNAKFLGSDEQPAQPNRLGLTDDLGDELLEFNCWKCQRADYAARDTIEIYKRRELRLLCIACQHPEKFKWTRDSETGREYLQPLAAKKAPPRKRAELPGEAAERELELRQNELRGLRLRRPELEELKAKVDRELEYNVARTAELEATTLPELVKAVSVFQTDVHRDARVKIEQLRAQIAHLEAELGKKSKGGRRG